MLGHLPYALPSPLAAPHTYLSVEERFFIFTFSPAYAPVRGHTLGKADPCHIVCIMRQIGRVWCHYQRLIIDLGA